MLFVDLNDSFSCQEFDGLLSNGSVKGCRENTRRNAAFKTLRVFGSFGCSDLKFVGKSFEHSVRSEFSCGGKATRVLRVHVTTMDAHFAVITLID